MERSEPSLVPEWLKGGTGNGVVAPQLSQAGLYQDDGGSSTLPRHRAAPQLPVAGGGQVDYDSPRGSASSDRVFSPSARRASSNSSSSIERANADRDSIPQGRPYSGFSRSSSIRSHDTPEWDRDANKGDCNRTDRDWDWEGERDLRTRERDRSFGFGTDDREKEQDRKENGMLRFSIAATSGKHEADAASRRPMSVALSSRIPDNCVRKTNEVVNVPSAGPSVSGGLVSSIQKAAFDRNFPSLGADEKLGVRPMSPGNASAITSPRPLWHGSPRSDLGRASSPGLIGSSSVGSISNTASSLSGVTGGTDFWSSALAESPSLNGFVRTSGVVAINLPNSTSGLMSSTPSGPCSTPSVNTLNMAEAVSQIPPRVRTPPQPSIESQRLEELALKQSRQLIPMTPSLPKTMSMADKAKPKPLRTIDGALTNSSKGSQLSASLQLNSPHRVLTPSRPDTPKMSQGKLLVLKSSKDGSASVSSNPKSDGINVPQGTYGNVGLMASAISVAGVSAVPTTGVIGQRKQSLDRRATLAVGVAGPDASLGLRGEDKPLSLQAQNRSEFFNALRKKAASNGSISFKSPKADSSLEPRNEVVNLREAVVLEETVAGSETERTCSRQESVQFLPETLSRGDITQSLETKLFLDVAGGSMEEPMAVDNREGKNIGVSQPGNSEEEEAAFMRSLGWEENAEGSELTEEEISAFYQMQEKKKLLNGRGSHWFTGVTVEQFVGSLGSVSSGLSSSESDSDNELHAKRK